MITRKTKTIYLINIKNQKKMKNYKDSNGNDLAQVVMCMKDGEVFTLTFSENESNACEYKINYFRDKGYAIYIYYVKLDVTEKWN